MHLVKLMSSSAYSDHLDFRPVVGNHQPASSTQFNLIQLTSGNEENNFLKSIKFVLLYIPQNLFTY